jgi:hypothetical protein
LLILGDRIVYTHIKKKVFLMPICRYKVHNKDITLIMR